MNKERGYPMTINKALDKYMKEFVNLDPKDVKAARKSRDNLLLNISEFSDDGFFRLWSDINRHFGSFARKTQCRELDDIDLMIGIKSEGATYNVYAPWDHITIFSNTNSLIQKSCTNEDGTLNSTLVLNQFKAKLRNVREYFSSEIHKNHEAVVLDLISKDWSFDIVPCFQTVKESNGRSYLLIPNGKGKWKKTDPDMDKYKVTAMNGASEGRLLELIRLCKVWNKTKNVKTTQSYMLETMLVNYAEINDLNPGLKYRFRDALRYISKNIYNSVEDLKDIQGDLNNLTFEERMKISNAAERDYKKIDEALIDELSIYTYKNAFQMWRAVLGDDFPKYE